MRTVSLLLLVALAALVESKWSYYSKRGKREVLVRSKRRWVLSTMEITENDKPPFPRRISTMFNDRTHNEGQRYEISGMGVDEEPLGVFKIDENTGEVFALKAVDREVHDLYKITFDIYSKKTGARLDKELSFNIEVKDLNDNAPLFDPPQMTYNVKENQPEDEPLGQLLANDRDQRNTNNSEFTMRILSQEPKEPKMSLERVREDAALLMFKGCFSYDKAKQYKVVVEAVDKGYPPLSSTGVVTINIVDTNSHLPTFKKEKYNGEVPEAMIKDDVLRIGVDDKDTPNTPGWRARYSIIKGNEGKNYEIKTDPVTNEGILSVVKGKDYERTSFTHLLIKVGNEEPLFVCKEDLSGTLSTVALTPHVINVTMKVIDVNDPPYYEKTKEDVYQKEEEPPGKVLFTPKVKDDDSDVANIRHVLLEDPADWVTIDPQTGTITTTKKMDRESPHVKDGIYEIIVGAIDDGEPPQTGSCTVLVHLGDINDNKPKLVSNGLIMCGDKTKKVILSAADKDDHPFGPPFTFALGGDDPTLKQRWKLDPVYGEESGLISLKDLAYGNYSVPLSIQDQQGSVSKETVEVMVCECGDRSTCRGKEPASSSLGPAGIGLFFLGLLLFLLLLLLIMCECRQKEFQKMNVMQDEGNQTLIKYNQEGGGSECKAEPTLLLTPTTNGVSMTDGIKMGTMQMSQAAPAMAQDVDIYNSSAFTTMNSNMTAMGTHRRSNTVRSAAVGAGQNMYSWGRSNTYTGQGGASRYNRSVSMRSNPQISDHIERRLYMINGNHSDHPIYKPYEYADEGQGSKCQSLDKLSLSNLGDDLMFVNDLGPKFNTLGGICHQAIQEKNIQL